MTITPAAPAARPGLVARLSSPGARRWYGGSIFGLIYQTLEVGSIWFAPAGSVGFRVLATAVLVVLYALYVVLPPVLWHERAPIRVAGIVAYWALTCVEFPVLGPTAIWIWTLIVVMIGFTWIPRVASFVLLAAIVGAQLLIAWSTGWADSVAVAPYVTLTVGIGMIGFGRLVQRNAQLREAQEEVARLAVSEERARLARDLHDSLGHSLTVVTVKSELARKLVGRDPEKAEAEIADIERLAREGLADLRAAVAGYRDVDLEAELASARTALAAAGIAAHLPDDAAVVRHELRPLFGWVVREGVTNVIRHSAARECWIELSAKRVMVRDDGSALSTGTGGNGLRNLRERAEAAGARLRSGPRADGGFALEVAA
ncbi:sensor histidine kinase [Pseudolysinimonas sp.]|uniref:sensor histidine kinase n=1 Tax=Pseudolysinimonas sp. TaxID=2680009 RepID=UPI003F801544